MSPAPLPHPLPQYNLPPPRLRQPLPRTITFQRKRANRRVVNEEELLAMLHEFGEVWLPALELSPFVPLLLGNTAFAVAP